MIDLHLHSTASDGQYTPSQLVELAKQKNITMMALTDHDTVGGLAEGKAAAQQAGIQFVGGIEISVNEHGVGGEFHVLGYGIDPTHQTILEMCRHFVQLRCQREEKIFAFLAERGVVLSREQVERYAINGLVARPHFARAMVDVGCVATVREAFDRYLAIPAFDAIERPKPTPEEGIRYILEAGGIPVLAHPVQLKLSEDALEQLVCRLKKMGLQGIECYYSTHTPKQTSYYLSLAKKSKLRVSGGSDFHGEAVKPEIEIGTGILGALQIPNSVEAEWRKEV